MKNITHGIKLRFFALAFAWTLICSFALDDTANTNVLFVTTDGSMSVDEKGNYHLPSEVVRAAMHAPECRPAEKDTNGNWGSPVEGFQLSIRLTKSAFNRWEDILASVIVRNVSDTNGISFIPDMASGRFFQIHLYDEHTNIIQPRSFRASPTFEEKLSHIVNSPKQRLVAPRTQFKWEVNLNGLYDLSAPGRRSLRVQLVTYFDGGGTNAVVTSGRAHFEINAPLK